MKKSGTQQRQLDWHKPSQLSEQQLEALGILQEECAEVIQEASKIRRSGPDFCRKGSDVPNKLHFQDELMDLMIIMEICAKLGVLEMPSEARMSEYMTYKIERLRNWSKLGDILDEL
jgi:NTP pyrophosphatase (non-canonical NTP hydrolase)